WLLHCRNGRPELVAFPAGVTAEIFKPRRELLGFRRLAKPQIGLAEMLAGAAVAGIEAQRLLIVAHGRPQLTQPPISIADIVLDVGVARVAQGGKLEGCDGASPITHAQCLLAGLEVGLELRP